MHYQHIDKNVQLANQLAEKAIARGLIKLADQNNNALAQYVLGLLYYKGLGVETDIQQAVQWYRKAAKQGEANAQRALGVMYEFGRAGLQIDYAKALSWYKKAKKNGYNDIDKDIKWVLKK